MFKKCLLLAVLVGLMSSVSIAQTIMLISDSGIGDVNDADNESKATGGKFVDESLVQFLENAGYVVDTSGMGGRYRRQGKDKQYNEPTNWWDPNDTTGRKDALLAADLIIFSKFCDSGSYGRDDGNSKNWNELPVPMLSQNAHVMRGQGHALGGSTKWGWHNGNNNRNAQGSLATVMAAVPMTHPAYTWVPKTALFDYSTNPGNGAKDTAGDHDGREPDLPYGDFVAGATILGYLENDPAVWGPSEGGPADDPALYGTDKYTDHPVLVHIPAGADFEAHNSNGDPASPKYGTAGADRAFLAIWSYDGSADYSWGMDVTTAYKDLFLAVVDSMID